MKHCWPSDAEISGICLFRVYVHVKLETIDFGRIRLRVTFGYIIARNIDREIVYVVWAWHNRMKEPFIQPENHRVQHPTTLNWIIFAAGCGIICEWIRSDSLEPSALEKCSLSSECWFFFLLFHSFFFLFRLGLLCVDRGVLPWKYILTNRHQKRPKDKYKSYQLENRNLN